MRSVDLKQYIIYEETNHKFNVHYRFTSPDKHLNLFDMLINAKAVNARH